MNKKIIRITIITISIILSMLIIFIAGFMAGEENCKISSVKEQTGQKQVCGGCWASLIDNNTNDRTNWVSVNVSGGDLKRHYAVCRHEVCHEAFYRECLEKNDYESCYSSINSEAIAELCEQSEEEFLNVLEAYNQTNFRQ